MRLYETAEKAVDLVISNYENNSIVYDVDTIRGYVYSWYLNTDVTDPEVLAACALEEENWFSGASYKYMLEAKDKWFPTDPYAGAPIWEIEAAQFMFV